MPRTRLATLSRPRQGRLVAGVSAGVARAWRIDPSIVRLGFIALTLSGGIGVIVYGILWASLPVIDDLPPPARVDRVDDVAAGVAIVGGLLVLRGAGVWFADQAVLVGMVAAVGAVLVWGRGEGAEMLVRDRLAPLRIAVGVALVAGGFVAFATITGDFGALGRTLLAGVVAAAGVAVLVGPRLTRAASDLTAERRARIRSEERAEIAAHLHDGVLQTLALIQQRAGANRDVASLARRQERELREWLYGAPAPDATLAAALARELAAVEDDQRVRAELVLVGDAPLDDSLRAVVAAVREATTNAARHGGVDRVDVYVEVEPTRVTAFVRDRGRGFDPSAVPPDRRGIADSLIGRVRRAGGTATVTSRPGQGTEVELSVPRAAH